MKMKKWLTLFMLVTMTSNLAVYGSSESAAEAAETPSGELTKIGYLSASWSDDYCKRLNDAFEALAPEYGFEIECLNGAPDGNPDVMKYMEGVDALMAGNPDALIIQPLFSLPDYLMKFSGQLPITFVDIPPEISETSADLDYWYAGYLDDVGGEQMAEAMSAGLKEGAKVCQLCLPYGQTNAMQKEGGFRSWMEENRPDVEIIETNWTKLTDTAEAQAIFEDWIQKYGVGGFDGCTSQSAMYAPGIIECMKKYGLDTSNFTFVNISASTFDWVREGYEYAELFMNPEDEARAALECTRAQLDGTTDQLPTKEGTDNYYAIKMVAVTADNVGDYDF